MAWRKRHAIFESSEALAGGFDAFVQGGVDEAQQLFRNYGTPVHCLSTRFGGVNYRVSLLMGFASYASKDYMATYNPNFYYVVQQVQAGARGRVGGGARAAPTGAGCSRSGRRSSTPSAPEAAWGIQYGGTQYGIPRHRI